MSNSDSSHPDNSPKTRPHRRLSLLQSTQNRLEPVEISAQATETAAPETTSAPTGSVRVMAYLSADEARILDETWLKLRSHPTRPSKSDILRAACILAREDFDQLTNILLQQQSSTLSRQRSSKAAKS